MMLDLTIGTVAAELLPGDLAVEQVLEHRRIDLPLQPEIGGNRPAPFGMLVGALRVIIADRIIAGDIGGRTLEAAGMDHAGRGRFAGTVGAAMRDEPAAACYPGSRR